MKKFTVLVLFACVLFSAVSVRAEPVTMVILAPIALEAAKQASPHVISGLRSGGRRMLEIGKDIGNVLRLPLGVLQATAGAPIGLLGDGLHNITIGLMAPLQLAGDTVMLPLSFFGIGG